MRVRLREWLRVAAAIALLGGVLWLLIEREVGPAALLRSAVWGLAVWVACGLIWVGLEYGQGHEDARVAREQLSDRPAPGPAPRHPNLEVFSEHPDNGRGSRADVLIEREARLR
jgi:hypothetical protein